MPDSDGAGVRCEKRSSTPDSEPSWSMARRRMITSAGTAGLPLLGSVHLGGLTLAQAQDMLTRAYSTYLTNPKITVELTSPQSLRYYLLGSFSAPGIKYPVHPLTLLEALALGGTVDLVGGEAGEGEIVGEAVVLGDVR